MTPLLIDFEDAGKGGGDEFAFEVIWCFFGRDARGDGEIVDKAEDDNLRKGAAKVGEARVGSYLEKEGEGRDWRDHVRSQKCHVSSSDYWIRDFSVEC